MIRLIAAADVPISLGEVKAFLRVTEADEDATIMALVRAAVDQVESFTGLGLLTSTWQQSWSTLRAPLVLYRRPVEAVTELTYRDAAGVMQTLDYRLAGAGSTAYAALYPATTWPAAQATAADVVTAVYTAGWPGWSDVPEDIRHAVMQRM